MSDIPTSQYRVSIWEGIGIAAGAVGLVVIGVAGLSVKALNNAFEPQRAEAVAQSLVNYAISGGSKGVFSTNIGGGKVAVVSSKAALSAVADGNSISLPLVEFMIAQIPVQSSAVAAAGDEGDEGNEGDEGSSDFLFSGFSFSNQTADAFQVTATRQEERAFCGTIAPVTIEEGNLTLAAQTPAVPAVRYQVQVTLNEDEHIAIVSAAGQSARENAASVFDSLRCKL